MAPTYSLNTNVNPAVVFQDADDAAEGARRLESIWGRRVARSGGGRTSLAKAVWRFCKTRTIIAILIMVGSIILQFAGPVSFQIQNMFHYILKLIQFH